MKHLSLVIFVLCAVAGLGAAAETIFGNDSSGEVLNAGETAVMLCADYDGTNLYIASNDGAGTEMCYWFKPCMSNNLFTFYKVGYRMVARTGSSTSGIGSSNSITWLNTTTSDNIGPVAIAGYADFVGGNHRWRTPDDNGNPGKGTYIDVRTANTDSYTIKVDGTVLLPGQERMGTAVTIDVHNTLYDPRIAPAAGDKVLSSALISEQVEYLVKGNSIDIKLTHTYEKDVTVSRYYGMQSMFMNETKLFTPCGAYASGITPSNVQRFTKGDYPYFSNIIEMDDNQWLQSAWLSNKSLGNHSKLNDNSIIFARSTGKSYHVMLNGKNRTAGSHYRWHGVYTWAKPVVNTASILAFMGYVDGYPVMFVNTKRTATDNTIPCPDGWKSLYTIDARGDIRVSLGGASIKVSSVGSATAVITLPDEHWLEADAVHDLAADAPAGDDGWFDVHGFRLQNEPQVPGIYIHNHKLILSK